MMDPKNYQAEEDFLYGIPHILKAMLDVEGIKYKWQNDPEAIQLAIEVECKKVMTGETEGVEGIVAL